ncbi:DUF4189 domain-containing protein [Nocardia uniformis]|uniref:DUF4189 domain-containing protein n=1 Tax=Nocardia uniformis TaxID=53432 RepID=A0A849C973_9NOCA|nr:DUF4189 domain-containing protein [Nocardia uniformis]NNH74278.1 DUF4189 domain-containing protein [Nocardia uniformis]
MSLARSAAFTAATAAAFALTVAGSANAASQYGTIALSELNGSAVASTDSSKVSSDAAAIRDCAVYDCRIVLRFTDGCGAIARGADGTYGWAAAPSRAEAETIAVTALGETNPPFPDLGSASPRPAHVILSSCTPNAM